jgi:hypothetical protein
MARRGALTRLHQVSPDGAVWLPATDVRAVFGADGAVVGLGAAAPGPPRIPPRYGELPPMAGDPPGESGAGAWTDAASPGGAAPALFARVAEATTTVRAAQVCAIVVGALALAAPTTRDATGALEWWPHQDALSIAVHGLVALVLVAWWIALALPPVPAMGSALSGACAGLAVAAALPVREWAPWMAPTAALLATNAVMLALGSCGGGLGRGAGVVASILAGAGAAALGVLAWRAPSAWSVGAGAFGVAGASLLLQTGVMVARGPGGAAMPPSAARMPGGGAPRAPNLFARAVLSSAALAVGLFVAAAGGLAEPDPMRGAAGAVAALLAVVLSVLAWAGARQGVQPDATHPAPR